MSAVIYIEGGGDGDEYLATLFRRAWTKFFQRAGLKGRMPRVMRGGGRNNTCDLFRTSVDSRRAGRIPLLLVDSEEAVAAGRSGWRHLRGRDGWDRPRGARDDQVFLMVQAMETWFLADRPALREFFGASLRERALPEWRDLEDVPKDDVLEALRRATAGCARPYGKGKVSFELLERIDPVQVEDKCPHAKALLDRLRRI